MRPRTGTGRRSTFPGSAVLALLLALLLFPLPTATAASFRLDEPIYHDGDEFVYEGYTAELLNRLRTAWENEGDLLSVAVTASEELTVSHLGSEGCSILGWSGDCDRARTSHSVNVTITWVENTTAFTNDTLNMSIVHTADHWKARGTHRYEKLAAVTNTETSFSGGGEDNVLEHDLRESTETERVGDWPDVVEVGSSWDVEMTETSNVTERTRENKGPWTESWRDEVSTQQVAYRALNLTTVHYGAANEKSHDTIIIRRDHLGDNLTFLDHFREEGFLARTEMYEGETLLLSTTLVEYSYYESEPHSVTSTSNWLLPAIIVGLVIMAIIAAGAAFAVVSSVPRARNPEQDEP